MSHERRNATRPRLVSQSKITVDEAEQLMRAVGASDATRAGCRRCGAPGGEAALDPHPDPEAAKEGREAKEVNIRVPIAVVRGGMRLGAIIATFASKKAANRMKERGIDLDLSKIHGDFSNMNGAEFDAVHEIAGRRAC